MSAAERPKVLLVHNYYQQAGGEDQSFAAEARLLEARGHAVLRYTLHNDAIDDMSKLAVAGKTLWNTQVYHKVRRLIRQERPQLLHCTNTFPLVSPAVYYAARAEGVPVVQALRNYRLLCLNSLLLRDGRVCEDCLGKAVPWPGVVHRCYRSSPAASGVVAGMLVLHRALGSYARAVTLYYTLTQFARGKFIQAGFSGRRILVKPNFLDSDPGPGPGGKDAVFVGRLSEEKGIATLLAAWDLLKDTIGLKIIGDGPLAGLVQQAVERNPAIQWLGPRSHEETVTLIGNAAFLVMPSVWYETFGRTTMEAFARGVPVLASRLGAMAELVEDGRTGFLFVPADAADLAATVRKFLALPSAQPLRQAARQEFEQNYTADRNYVLLRTIYDQALSQGKSEIRNPKSEKKE